MPSTLAARSRSWVSWLVVAATASTLWRRLFRAFQWAASARITVRLLRSLEAEDSAKAKSFNGITVRPAATMSNTSFMSANSSMRASRSSLVAAPMTWSSKICSTFSLVSFIEVLCRSKLSLNWLTRVILAARAAEFCKSFWCTIPSLTVPVITDNNAQLVKIQKMMNASFSHGRRPSRSSNGVSTHPATTWKSVYMDWGTELNWD
mmetsp:Transcript_64479/g.172675  ORF Transcript_64479/g.172675 Transcript_64479/m.172675 type:complete len:206 (-) Transcript_64479:930-1547(-)